MCGMTCANVMPRFGPAVSVGYRCRDSSPPPPALECRHCPPVARREKRVAFADAKGLALITVRLFSETEDQLPLRIPRLTKPGGASETRTLSLGFQQPCADFLTFRSRLQHHMVLLESCDVTGHSVLGTVRVKNVCFEKLVQVRVTFDTWRSFQDVSCTYLNQSYGEPGTDVFGFDIGVPEGIERMEFCVFYVPVSLGVTEWDNNDGKNYRIDVRD